MCVCVCVCVCVCTCTLVHSLQGGMVVLLDGVDVGEDEEEEDERAVS